MAGTHPRRSFRLSRLFRFSLGSLFLVVTLSGIWLGLRVNRARNQRLAVEAITQVGGRVEYDYGPDQREMRRRQEERLVARRAGRQPPIYVDKPWAPEWLIERVGLDLFTQVVEVDLSNTMATDKVLATVRLLPGVKRLDLQHTPLLTDEALVYPQALPNLRSLILTGNRYKNAQGDMGLTNGALRHVGRLRRLTTLDLAQNRFDDDGLKQIEGLTQLTHLNLQATEITENGLIFLSRMKRLERLSLDVPLTDTALRNLRPLKNLEWLNALAPTTTDAGLEQLRGSIIKGLVLTGSQATDDGVKTIRTMPFLEFVSLARTQISDAALNNFRHLPDIRQIDLRDTDVSDIGHLAQVRALESLDISSTRVSDVTPLANLKRLKSLSLGNTPVSDVTPLTGLTDLEFLSLTNTQISDITPLANLLKLKILLLENTLVSKEDCETLEKALPMCHIQWSESANR